MRTGLGYKIFQAVLFLLKDLNTSRDWIWVPTAFIQTNTKTPYDEVRMYGTRYFFLQQKEITERNDLLMNEKVPLKRLTHARTGFNLITNYHAWIQHNLDFIVF